MDPLLPSTDTAASLSGLAGMLSSLGPFLDSNAATASAFADFLEQNQDAISVPSAPPSPPAPEASDPAAQNTVSQANGGNFSPDNPPVPAVLQKVVYGLRHILNQLNGQGGKTPQNKTQADNAPARTDASNTAPAQTNVSTGAAASKGAAANAPSSTGDNNSSTVSADGNGDTDNNNAPNSQTLARILSELVALMRMIEKKLEMAQSVTGTTAGASTPANSALPADPEAQAQTTAPGFNPLLNLLAQIGATAGSGSDNTPAADPVSPGNAGSGQPSAADPLTQLLALIQAVEQKLASSSTDALQGAGVATSNAATPSVLTSAPASNPAMSALSDFFQMRKDLKELLVSLQNATANNNPSTDNSTDTASSSDPSVTTGALPKTADPAQANKPVQDLAGNLFNFFGDKTNDIFGAPPPATAFAPATAGGLIADGQNGGALDTGAQDGGASSSNRGAGNAGGLMADNTILPALADGAKAADPYSFASQLSAARAMNGGTTGLPSAVDQVLLQLNRGVKNGDDQMTIQLQPADLGKINIKLDISGDGKVQGTVVADNPATLSLLLKDVRGLERALQEAGLRADPGSLQFSLGGQSGNTSGNASGQTANNFAGNASSDNNTSSGTADTSLDISADTGEAWILTPGRVNFKV